MTAATSLSAESLQVSAPAYRSSSKLVMRFRLLVAACVHVSHIFAGDRACLGPLSFSALTPVQAPTLVTRETSTATHGRVTADESRSALAIMPMSQARA